MFALTRQKNSQFEDIIERLDAGRGTNGTWSGASVNSRTAMQQATVYACVRILAETIASLPIKVQQVQRAGAVSQWVDADHDALGVLARPNPWQTQHDLLSMWVAWSEIRGNAFSYKTIGTRSRVLELLPLGTTGVDVEQLRDWTLVYSVSSENGFSGTYGPDQVFHLRNFGTDGYEGISTIGKLRNDIGLAQRAKEHGARVLESGGTMNLWINADGAVKNREKALEMQESFTKQYGGAHNRNKTPVLWGGATLNEIGMTAQDAQLLETLRFQKQEIASIFGVPLFLLNDTEKATTWGTGLEQITKSFLRFSLRPRLNRIQSTLQRELLGRNEQRTTRFVFETEAFTLGSLKETMEAAQLAVMNGVLSPNEARELINKNPRDGGDEYRESPNSTPEMSGEGTENED